MEAEKRVPASGALDRRRAAEYLAISTRTLDDLASRGDIRKTKIGRKTVFRIQELARFLLDRQESEVSGDSRIGQNQMKEPAHEN